MLSRPFPAALVSAALASLLPAGGPLAPHTAGVLDGTYDEGSVPTGVNHTVNWNRQHLTLVNPDGTNQVVGWQRLVFE